MKFPSLLPKKDPFSGLLAQLSSEAHRCAGDLKIFVESSDPSAIAAAGAGISACKARAKTLAMEVTQELCRSFITPYDREDIQDFAAALYKIPKLIEKIKDRMELHQLSRDGDLLAQIDLILQEAEAMDLMVHALINKRDARQIQDKVELLHALEQKGDAILSDRLGQLFRGNHDARELILRKDTYDMLEKVIDRYRDAAAVAFQIVLKHS